MADLSYIQATGETKIVGQNASGTQVNYVSADANGNMNVVDYASGSATGGTAATVSLLTGGQYNSTLPTLTTAQQSAFQLDINGRVITNAAIVAAPSDVSVSGTLTNLSSVVTISLNGAASLNVDVSGPGFVGIIMVQVITPSSSRSLPLFPLSSTLYTPSITANGSYRVASLPGSGTVNVVFTSYTSGSANILLRSSTAPYYVQPFNLNAGNLLTQSWLYDGNGSSVTLGQKVSASSLPVVLASDQSGISTFQDKIGNGSISALNGTIVSTTNGCSTIVFTVVGTWAGVLQIQGTVDGTNWVNLNGVILPAGQAQSTLSSNSTVSVPCGGFQNVRLIATSFSSGTANITWDAGAGNNVVQVIQATYSNLNVAAYQPTASNLQTTARLNDGSGNAITSTAVNSKQRLDVNIASETADGSTAPFFTTQVGGQDPTGKLQAFQTLPNGEQFTRDVINIGGQSRVQTVTTTTTEALGGTTRLVNRKFISIRPLTGTVYWGFTNSSANFPIYTNETFTISATDNVPIYILATVSTTAAIAEGA